jgi:hypothetical protein
MAELVRVSGVNEAVRIASASLKCSFRRYFVRMNHGSKQLPHVYQTYKAADALFLSFCGSTSLGSVLVRKRLISLEYSSSTNALDASAISMSCFVSKVDPKLDLLVAGCELAATYW